MIILFGIIIGYGTIAGTVYHIMLRWEMNNNATVKYLDDIPAMAFFWPFPMIFSTVYYIIRGFSFIGQRIVNHVSPTSIQFTTPDPLEEEFRELELRK